MVTTGLHDGQLRTVRGFADTELRIPNDPLDPRNRRVTIVVRSQVAAALESAVRDVPTAAGAAAAAPSAGPGIRPSAPGLISPAPEPATGPAVPAGAAAR